MNENDRSILVNLRREEMVTVYHMSAEFKLFKLLVSKRVPGSGTTLTQDIESLLDMNQ